MRIEKIRIKNYRRFRDTEISFNDNVTLLAGANNSGKTSLVHLLDCVFCNHSNLKLKDISLERQGEITKRLFEIFNKQIKSSILTDSKKLQLAVEEVFINKEKEKLNIVEEHISLQISLIYEAKDNISLFAQYLMDLDENKRNFYFEIVQVINPNTLRRNIDSNLDSLQNYMKRYLDEIKRKKETESPKGKIGTTRTKQLIIEKLFKIYGDSLEIIYKYANEDFSIGHKIEKRDFTNLFNYSYLSADRKLDDNFEDGKRTLTSNVVDLLNAEKKSETSASEWKSKTQQILDKMVDAFSDENIDTYLMEQAKKLLGNVSENLKTVGETNIKDMTMVIDMGEKLLYQILKEGIRVNYEITIDTVSAEKVLLGEESQGLGISNLIYITLNLMRYRLESDSRLVNLYVIEEPESHMHLQMQRTLINFLSSEYYGKEEHYNIQGLITTHSDEIVRSANLRDIRVIRPKEPLINVICDMSEFLDRHENEKDFYETFFRINFSNMIFSDKAIIYEGDTERMYIESLIFGNRSAEEKKELDFLDKLSKKYITYAQVGGAYAHKYAELLNELEISTLILTDIDYSKLCLNKDEIFESKTTNAALTYFCKDEKRMEENTNLCIKDIYEWQLSCTEENNILVKTQLDKDGYARTLEESLLFQYIKNCCEELVENCEGESEFSVFTDLTRDKWDEIKKRSCFYIALPNRTKQEIREETSSDEIKRSIRQIVEGFSGSKSNFMYSIIIAREQYSVLPNYIKEGLKWLAEK